MSPAQRATLLADPTTRAALARRVERAESLFDFVERISPRYQRPTHLARVARLFDRIRAGETVRALVFAPPRHGKTELLLHGLAQLVTTPGWEHDLLGYVSYGATFAEGKSLRARGYAELAGFRANPRKDSAGKWIAAVGGGGLLATGIDGPVLGEGFRVLVVDDPHKSRVEVESPRQRAKVLEYWKGTLLQRLEPGASVLVTHQRWHDEDLIGCLKAEGRWEVVDLPALDAHDRPLWAARFDRAALDAIRRDNEYNWWSQYMGSPRPRGGAVFKREPYRFDGSGKDGRRLLIGVDAAGTESTRSDYTVAVALAVAGAGDATTCNVVDLVRVQLEPQDAAKVLRDFQAKHGGPRTVIEASRDGKAIARSLRLAAPGLALEEVPAVGDKFVRAQPYASAWNDARGPRVGVPADAEAHPWVADFLAEHRLFTGRGDKHDDIVDACAHGWTACVGAPTPRTLAESYVYE